MSSHCKRFQGRIALVTGGAAGMGRATVHRLVDEGLATIVIVDHDAEGAAREIEKVKAAGGDGFFVECDLADIKAVKRMGSKAGIMNRVVTDSNGNGVADAGEAINGMVIAIPVDPFKNDGMYHYYLRLVHAQQPAPEQSAAPAPGSFRINILDPGETAEAEKEAQGSYEDLFANESMRRVFLHDAALGGINNETLQMAASNGNEIVVCLTENGAVGGSRPPISFCLLCSVSCLLTSHFSFPANQNRSSGLS